jgi:hypothetical protein
VKRREETKRKRKKEKKKKRTKGKKPEGNKRNEKEKNEKEKKGPHGGPTERKAIANKDGEKNTARVGGFSDISRNRH